MFGARVQTERLVSVFMAKWVKNKKRSIARWLLTGSS